MRLIDQDGCADLPYETTTLVIDEGSVIARIPDGGKILIAQYSNIEKAKKAMRDLRIAQQKLLEDDPMVRTYYGKPSEYFLFPSEEEL